MTYVLILERVKAFFKSLQGFSKFKISKMKRMMIEVFCKKNAF